MASTVLPNGIIIPEKYSRDWYNDLYHNWQELDNLLAGGGANDGTLTIQKNGDTVGTFSANQATDETINISVPDVNNGTLTIQKNGTTVDSFSANSSTDKTVDITVPTKTSDLTNDSGYITSDNTKIPLAGSNQISGDLIPSTTDTVNLGSPSYQWNQAYIKSLTINGVACGDILTHNASEFVPVTGGAVITGTSLYRTVDTSLLTVGGGSDLNSGFVRVHGKDYTDSAYAGKVLIRAKDNSNAADLLIQPDGSMVWNDGVVITGDRIRKPYNSWYNAIIGGADLFGGARVFVYGNAHSSAPGNVKLSPATSDTIYKDMVLQANGTWTWNGTSVQITSDQRLKQQITQIDDKLLDAWEDVELSQFKYNDAVDQKGDNARLHTGYVVQQIDSACQKHDVDISAYGLYCHEEYPQETEEVEVEQADGTKTKETKVIREASEHYSLRYTEVYAVECMYLRRCIKQLTARIEELEKGNNNK